MTHRQGELIALGQQTLTASVPLILAGLGELVSQRCGVVNIGLEGLMLGGCFSAYIVTGLTGSGMEGLAAATLAAMTLAGLFALTAVWWRADAMVCGMALNLLVAGLSGSIWPHFAQRLADLPPGSAFDRYPVPILAEMPVIGPLFFQHYPMVYLLGGLVMLTAWALRQTRTGLIIQAMGEAPEACEAAGLSVRGWRTGCLLFSGACAGGAGAYLSIMRTHTFQPEMTGGQGFMILALVIFGRWRVPGLVAGSLLFGLLDSFGQYQQSLGMAAFIPFQYLKMLPYVATLGALCLVAPAGFRRHGCSF